MQSDFQYDLKWEIDSFRVVAITKGRMGDPIECLGASFSEKAQQVIKSSSSGTLLLFQDIKVSSQAGSRTIDGFYIIIK